MSEGESVPVDEELLDKLCENFRFYLIRVADMWWRAHKDAWPEDPNQFKIPEALAEVLHSSMEGWVVAHWDEWRAVVGSGSVLVGHDVKKEYVLQVMGEDLRMLRNEGYVSSPHWVSTGPSEDQPE